MIGDMYECKTTNKSAHWLAGRAAQTRRFAHGPMDQDLADAYERAARELDALAAGDAECRRMIHEARGVSDDRDFDTPFELGGMIAEFTAERDTLRQRVAVLEAAAKALGAGLVASQPMDPMEVVASEDDAVWRAMAEACGCPTQCVECYAPLVGQFDFQRQQCAECWEAITGEAE